MNVAEISAAVAAIEPWMIETRRQLHQIPELGFEEFETQKLIMGKLEALGIPFTTERTWVIGLIEGGKPGKTVAFRADMDALPLDEQSSTPYCSRNPGRMHACGHDAHTAIQLGAAKVLFEHRAELAGNVKLLFQPAEETVGGALPMVQAGCLENPHVDGVFGLHVAPTLPLGVIETRLGAMNASTDDLDIIVHGKSGHGAHPEGGVDAIVCAAQLITALQTLISRGISPTQAAVIHIGKIQGGVAPNVLCDKVTLTGTVRTTDANLRANIKRRIREVSGGICQALGCAVEVNLTPDYCALINDVGAAKLVLATAEQVFGAHAVIEGEAPSMGAEDFGYLCEHTPGAFYMIGCADPGRMPAQPLHSRGFSLDERCLAVGAKMQVALANAFLRG
ncbi:MAG: amidohydrolase [Clostridia bacterium]